MTHFIFSRIFQLHHAGVYVQYEDQATVIERIFSFTSRIGTPTWREPIRGGEAFLLETILESCFYRYRSEGTSVDNEMTIWTPASVDCNFPEGVEISPCRSWLEDCLFDLTNDPCEQNNIARSYPAMLDLLRSKLVEYNATSVPIQNKPFDPMSNPDLYGGIFVPWKDPNEILDKVPLVYQDFNPVDSV